MNEEIACQVFFETWRQYYYTPLEQRLTALRSHYAGNADAMKVVKSHEREMNLYRQYADYYGYTFLFFGQIICYCLVGMLRSL
ncbi:hypothetical protein PN498_26295 [Oscillatoria sp. CS-180]|uniref:hypothetical protein n=1 Tax=Oscillatoria sp. CS-180 TaxID=3021720 RepID=UPI00232DA006|nr:hypothetical protein [Oscillatoria sp. CS-180]MDB9529529.1 hypothetical protein [Oscillatoria sp. CS-180]